MANRDSKRTYRRHTRHDTLGRIHYSRQFKAFLAAQATRLTRTSAQIFTFLKKNTADRIRKAAVYTDLS